MLLFYLHVAPSLGEDHLMSRSFHVATTSTAHRRRTDLLPTIVMTPANKAGIRLEDGSRSSTPGHKMLHSKTTGRGQSMPRLDHLARPRVLVIPHETPARNRLHNTARVPTANTPTKSLSMVQLCGANSPRERKVLRTKALANGTGQTGKVQCILQGDCPQKKALFSLVLEEVESHLLVHTLYLFSLTCIEIHFPVYLYGSLYGILC